MPHYGGIQVAAPERDPVELTSAGLNPMNNHGGREHQATPLPWKTDSPGT